MKADKLAEAEDRITALKAERDALRGLVAVLLRLIQASGTKELLNTVLARHEHSRTIADEMP